nr:myosin-2-like isoform X2 [Ipomoea batatas]
MRQLDTTTPHFICCIKPNNKQLPGVFEKELVLQQLRYVGVFEAVRISRSGYPTKMTHQCFSDRYGFLLDNNVSKDPLSTAVAVLQQFNVLPELYQGWVYQVVSPSRTAIRGFLARRRHYSQQNSQTLISEKEETGRNILEFKASVAAVKNLGSDNAAVSPPPYYYDSEDIMSLGLQTSGASTPLKFPYNGVNLESNREMNGGVGAMNHLVREFEQRKHYFDNEATAISEVKAGQSLPSTLEEELKRLVLRFENWKKSYKGQLSEAKAKGYEMCVIDEVRFELHQFKISMIL